MSLLLSSGRIFADVKVSRCRGEAGLGFHRLLVDLQLQVTGWDPNDRPQLTDLSAVVSIQPERGGPYPLGRMRAQPHALPILPTDQAHESQLTLEMELDPRRLEAVEALRRGGSIILLFNLQAWVVKGFSHRCVLESASLHLIQGVWVDLLAQLGYRRTLLLEIPIPDGGASPAMARVVSRLEEAHRAFLDGRWRDTVGTGREVMEALSRALGQGKQDSREVNEALGKTSDKGKEDRIRLMRSALWVTGCAARHEDDVTAKIEWDREDALAALGMMTALVRRYITPGPTGSTPVGAEPKKRKPSPKA